MSSCPKPIVRRRPGGWMLGALLALTTVLPSLAEAQVTDRYPGIGRAATAKEVAAWDIDVRPDFKGLPAGSGSVNQGQDVWEARCASCHGVFGESNEVFSPLVGGTTADDIKTGRVANLKRADYPSRTTLMKVPTLSTLWDYINRAMPWNAPKSLSTNEVYAVTAYLLNLGGIVGADFTLSDKNMAEVQQRMPNRNGMSTQHAMWPGKGLGVSKPDVSAQACMNNCAVEAKVASILPDFARNAHGDLSAQNRLVGPQRGADTTKPEVKGAVVSMAPKAPAPALAAPAPATASAPQAAAPAGAAARAALQKNGCVACHAQDRRVIGPSWAEIAGKHGGKTEYLSTKIKAGSTGVWGPIPMPPQSLADAERQKIAEWLATGAKP